MADIYRDLLIVSGDVVLDDGDNPIIIVDRDVIAQDIKHALLESGLVNLLVAERSTSEIADVEYQIITLAENDIRIIPGTAEIEMIGTGTGDRLLRADTYEFGRVDIWL